MWKELPRIAIAFGQNAFKCHMDRFLEPLVVTLSRPGTHQLAVHAAIDCVKKLGEFVDLNVFHDHLLKVCGDEIRLNVNEEVLNLFPSSWKMVRSPAAVAVRN